MPAPESIPFSSQVILVSSPPRGIATSWSKRSNHQELSSINESKGDEALFAGVADSSPRHRPQSTSKTAKTR
jgi:hypothetical protein